MQVLGGILFFCSFIAIFVFIILGIVALIKKNGKAKSRFIKLGGSFIVAIISMIIIGVSGESEATTIDKEKLAKEQKTEKAETLEEKAKAEKQAKEEAEKKAKEEAKAELAAKKKAEAEKRAKEEAEKKAKEEAAAKKANAKPIEYNRLKKNPDKMIGEYTKYTGKVVQIQEEEDFTAIRLAVTKTSYGYDPNDIIMVMYAGTTDYIEDDVITVYGTISGKYNYTSQAGWEISIPSMLAEEFEK
ncbi:hypothetical protein ACQKL5_18185 [Peribacillus sp. NPDC097675]|uniref:hypothetical protein n=1 Tax=Peribacillus sp. NPDC097675 TaxID=3390618 RepID=UPI003CFF4AD0